jgi:hypothetical protein
MVKKDLEFLFFLPFWVFDYGRVKIPECGNELLLLKSLSRWKAAENGKKSTED